MMHLPNETDTVNPFSSLYKQVKALLSTESDPVANAANLSALLFHNLPKLNWVGFYYLKGNELVLGPFQGQVACTRIPLGKGVCGTAFAQNSTQVVADVHAFPGHIACDTASESEIVVPFSCDVVEGVLDVDSPVGNRFGDQERAFFEVVVEVYLASLK